MKINVAERNLMIEISKPKSKPIGLLLSKNLDLYMCLILRNSNISKIPEIFLKL